MAPLEGQAFKRRISGFPRTCSSAGTSVPCSLCSAGGIFSGEFPRLAKAGPSSSNTCWGFRAQKLPHLLGVWDLSVNHIYFWVLREEKAEKPDHRVLKTPGAHWGQKPHHKLCLTLVLNITEHCTLWFFCFTCSAFPHRPPLHLSCHPLEPSVNFGETQKDFCPQENGLNLGSCVLSAFFTTQTENSAGCADLKVFLLLSLVPPQQNAPALDRKSI